MEHSTTTMQRSSGVTLMKAGEESFPQWIGLVCLTVAAILSWMAPSTGSDLGEESFLEGNLLVLATVLLIIVLPAALYLRASRKSAARLPSTQQQRIITQPSNQAVSANSTAAPLSPSPGAWSPGRARVGNPAVGKIRSILNKLTEENFDKLFGQLEACLMPSYSEELLQCLVKEVFEKATQQHTHKEDHFIGLYTKLCKGLHERLGLQGDEWEWMQGDQHREPPKQAFKRILKQQCQQTFDRYQEVPVFAEDLCEEELEEEQLKHKIKRLGNMKFAGHLVSQELLPAETVPSLAKELLPKEEELNAEDLEALCALLTVCGPFFDREPRAGSDEFERLMSQLSNRLADGTRDAQALPRRVLCFVRDLLELRCRSWEARKKQPAEESDGSDMVIRLNAEPQSPTRCDLRSPCLKQPTASKIKEAAGGQRSSARSGSPSSPVIARQQGSKLSSPAPAKAGPTPQELAAKWFGGGGQSSWPPAGP